METTNESQIESTNELQLNYSSEVVQENSTTKQKRLSKREKKFNRYQIKIANYKLKKLEKKKLKEQATSENNESNVISSQNLNKKEEYLYETYLNKRELKKKTIERLKTVLDSNGSNCLKICIDCSFSDLMSEKELSRLAQQIGRCYASNKSLNQPVFLTLCNLKTDSKFYKECCRVNDGFAKYLLQSTDKSIEEHFSQSFDSIAYLSPDSPNLLETLDNQTTYVIGGLVDETVNKKVTFTKCSNLSIKTYSLPIEKYMSRKVVPNDEFGSKTYNFNKILAINQVFDILANQFITNDWCKSLEIGVPKRKGFIIENKKENDSKSDSDAE